MVVTEPLPALVQRHQKQLVAKQIVDMPSAVMALPHGITQCGTETLQQGGFIEKALQIRWQALDHFLQ